MMGTSMVFSFRGLFKNNISNMKIIWKIVWRSVLLFGIGLFLGTKYGYKLQLDLRFSLATQPARDVFYSLY